MASESHSCCERGGFLTSRAREVEVSEWGDGEGGKERRWKWAHCSFFTFWGSNYRSSFPNTSSTSAVSLACMDSRCVDLNWGCEWSKSLARRPVQMLTLRCGAECCHRNKTLGDPVCLNYVCRRERINHCWCLHIGCRRNIAFYILQTTFQQKDNLQGAFWRLLRERGGTWGKSMVNKLKNSWVNYYRQKP